MPHHATVHVSLDAIAHNHRVIADALAPDTTICPVLKADAYALGANRIARKLASLPNIDLLAVYHNEEARQLLRANAGIPILILAPATTIRRDDTLFIALSRQQIHLTIHDHASLEHAIHNAESLGITLPVHLEVNTGIARAGCSTHDAPDIIRRILHHPRLALEGIATHFTNADSDDDVTRRQLADFRQTLPQDLPASTRVHAANSFALFRDHQLHLSTVRVGLALLGYAADDFQDPDNANLHHHAARLRPAVRWTTTLTHVKDIAPNQPVGYGATWSAPNPGARIGTVPIGYADGLPLALSSDPNSQLPRAAMRIRIPGGAMGKGEGWAHAPIVGRVSMDQTTLDLSNVPPAAARVGATVEIVSDSPAAPNHLPTLARAAGTITHELLCRINPNIPRDYTTTNHAAQPAAQPSTATHDLKPATLVTR